MDRCEIKCLCTNIQLALIRSRIAPLTKPDPHQKAGGTYQVRSLYLDDADNSCLFSNLRGEDNRYKFRIRSYNMDPSFLRLERKWKRKVYTRKDSLAFAYPGQNPLLGEAGMPDGWAESAVARHFLMEQKMHLLHPVIMIEYYREAFLYPLGNVRITFDTNIGFSMSTQMESLFDSDLPMIPLLPPGQQILEVKYDSLIPDFIMQALDIGSLEQTSFSKYAMCRSPL